MANVTRDSAQVVSDQMTAIWNNFDDGSKSLEYYADVITALGAATASSTDEIAQGLEKFAAVASTVGLSYEYATSALATITAETRQSADVVGTALKTLFARIQGLSLGETLDDGTDLNKYSEALAKVGISIKDSNGGLKDMDTLLEEMAAKWQTLNKDQQVALAQTVAGVRQYTQLVALMDNWGAMQTNLNTAANSEGTLQE
jgi:TP901 family phage tail tape measure protein